jgi:hypothetical protein
MTLPPVASSGAWRSTRGRLNHRDRPVGYGVGRHVVRVEASPRAAAESRGVQRGDDPDEPAAEREDECDHLDDHVVVQVEVPHRDGDQESDHEAQGDDHMTAPRVTRPQRHKVRRAARVDAGPGHGT